MIKARQDALLRRGMPETGQSWSDTRLLLLCPPEVEQWLHQQMNAIMPEFWNGGRLVFDSKFEPPCGKTNNMVSEQVLHKSGCTVTEAG